MCGSLSDTPEDHGVVMEHDPSKDNRTIFVSNLDYSTTSDQIREVFESVGTITELRLVKDFKGRSKGFCYIVFSSFVSASIFLNVYLSVLCCTFHLIRICFLL